MASRGRPWVEVVPSTHLSARPPLCFGVEEDGCEAGLGPGSEAARSWGAGGAAGNELAESRRRRRGIRDSVLSAWTAAVRAVPPAQGPAFLVRIMFAPAAAAAAAAGAGAGRGKGRAAAAAVPVQPPPPPHMSGPLLLIYADGAGGFVAGA